MCRLRTNFARLGDPMQGPHNGNAPLSPPTAVLLLKGSMSLDSQTSGRMPKGKRLYGQARRLLIRPCVFYAEYAPTVPTNPVPLPPRRGKFALRSASKLTSNSRHSAAKTSPSGGGAVGRRGAFPRAKRGCTVFAAARQHTYSSPLGDTFPSEPYEPSEPFEPCHAVAPWAIPQPSAAARLSNFRTLRPPGRSILRTFSIIQWKNIKNFEPYWIFVKNFV